MLSLYIYNKNDHAVPNFTRSSNYASSCVSKTVWNMHQNILLWYSNYFLNNFQYTYLTKQRNFIMEFLDSGATCTTSLVSKSAYFVVLENTNQKTYTRRFETYSILRMRLHIIHTDAWYTLRSSHFIYLNIVIISQSFLRQAQSLYQSQTSTQSDLVLPILIPNTSSIL